MLTLLIISLIVCLLLLIVFIKHTIFVEIGTKIPIFKFQTIMMSANIFILLSIIVILIHILCSNY